MTSAAYTTDGSIGIAVTASAVTVPQFPLGLTTELSDGTKWRYVKIPSGTTIINNACYTVQGGTTGVSALTSTNGLQGFSICIAQQAVTSNSTDAQYVWMLIANPRAATGYKVKVAASCAIDAKLATTANGGTLDDTTAGTVLRIDGIVLTDSQPAGSSGSRTFRTSSFPLGWGAV